MTTVSQFQVNEIRVCASGLKWHGRSRLAEWNRKETCSTHRTLWKAAGVKAVICRTNSSQIVEKNVNFLRHALWWQYMLLSHEYPQRPARHRRSWFLHHVSLPTVKDSLSEIQRKMISLWPFCQEVKVNVLSLRVKWGLSFTLRFKPTSSNILF